LSRKDAIETVNEAVTGYLSFILFWVAFCFSGILRNLQVMLVVIPNLKMEIEDNKIVKVPFKTKCKMQYYKVKSLCYHLIAFIFAALAFNKNARYNIIANAIYIDIDCTNLVLAKDRQIKFDHKEWIEKMKKGDTSVCIYY
jgi:hypothetical protein